MWRKYKYIDLLSSTETQDEMESGLLLDVVVRKSAAIFELLASEDQSLLIWRNALLVLDLGLHVLNGIRWLDLKGDGLSGQGLDEDLHTTSQSQHQVESRLFLDVVVRKSAAVLELFTSEDETLLIWWDTLLVLDLSLHVLNGIRWLNLQCDRLSGESLDEDLHTTTETQDEMESRLFLDVVVG